MALSNIDKSHLNELLISINGQNNENNLIEVIKSNHAQYAQLKLIAKQMQTLKQEAISIMMDAQTQNNLHNIKTSFKLTSGNSYYLYEKINDKNKKEEFFSLISPSEWNTDLKEKNIKYLGKYYYDYDKQFIKIDN
jgi:hypothetical protein